MAASRSGRPLLAKSSASLAHWLVQASIRSNNPLTEQSLNCLGFALRSIRSTVAESPESSGPLTQLGVNSKHVLDLFYIPKIVFDQTKLSIQLIHLRATSDCGLIRRASSRINEPLSFSSDLSGMAAWRSRRRGG
jgi:hypothetical protein